MNLQTRGVSFVKMGWLVSSEVTTTYVLCAKVFTKKFSKQRPNTNKIFGRTHTVGRKTTPTEPLRLPICPLN